MFVRKNEPQDPLPLVLVVLQLISKSVESMMFLLYVKVGIDWHPIPQLLPPHTLHFSHISEREMRVTGDEAQGTMGRRKKRGDARFLHPDFLCTQILIERCLGTRQIPRCFMLLKPGYTFPPEEPLGSYAGVCRRYGYLSFFLYVQVGLECNQIPLVKLLFEESII